MEDSPLFGEYSKYTRRVFTRGELESIKAEIIKGNTIAKIAKDYQVDYWVISTIFKEFILNGPYNKNKNPTVKLGHKDEEYYTEEEMLSGIDYSSYTWDNLTEEEKQFYLNYGTEDNNRDDSSLE